MKRFCADIFNHLYTLPHGSITTFRLLLLLLFISPPLIPLVGAQKSSSDSTISGGDSLNTNNVSPSMAVIVIVLVLAFFITGCVSIYIQQCAETASSSTIPAFLVAAGDGRSRRGSVRGLDRSVIATFPTFLYSAVKELKIGKGSLECAVCLNEFEDDETLRLLPKCDHVFHPDCIDTWLAGHTTCPVCRANLVPEQPLAGNSAESTHGIDSDGELEVSTSGEDNSRCEVQIITINEEGTANVNIPKRNPNRKFPRSHSTGHSLSRPADDWERYTLRLPAEVRRQLVARARLKRATSLVALPRESSSRRGCRSSGDREGSGSSRYGRLFGRGSGRWPFNFALPAFVSRDGSFRSTATKVAAEGDVTAGSVSSKRSGGTAVTPLEFLPPLHV